MNSTVEAKTYDEQGSHEQYLKLQYSNYDANDEVNVIVQLDEKCAEDYDVNLSIQEIANHKKIVDKVLKSQETYKEKIQKIDKNAKFQREYYLLLNGFSVKTKYSNIEKINNINGIKNVTLSNVYLPEMASAKEITNIEAIWEKYKYKGEGMVVAVIDSGVDFTHKDMRISDGVEVKLTKTDVEAIEGKGKYFSNKIPYGYNFADDNFDIKDRTGVKAHGMHVSGIIAANGEDEDVKDGKAIKGVAPEAQILAMKVFSNNSNAYASSEDIIAAIEDSIAHGADVINMSLGSVAGFRDENDPEQIAINKAAEKGIICVTAAGNDQIATKPYKFNGLPDSGLVDTPTVSKDTLSVASCANSRIYSLTMKYSSDKEKGSALYSYVAEIGDPMEMLSEEYELVDCGFGRAVGTSETDPEADDFKDKDLKGKIALIERGEISFSSKALNAQKNGAVAVVIYNNETGGEELVNMIGFNEENKIPTVFVFNSVGEKLKSLIGKNLKIKFDDQKEFVDNPLKGDMSIFSSWGPTPGLEFKPEITAPGGNIWSTYNDSQYGLMSGTSMSTPHTSGIMALVKQHMKNLNVEFKDGFEEVNFAKALVMNTAKVMVDPATNDKIPFSPRRMGAGFIDGKAAIDNFVTVTYEETGEAAVALKEIKNNDTSFNLILRNYGDKDVSYKVSDLSGVLTEQEEPYIDTVSYDVKIEGAKVDADQEIVQVLAGKTTSVNLTLKLPKELTKERFIEGYIRFESQDKNIPSLAIPYMGFYGEWDKNIIIDLPAYDENCYWGESYLKNVNNIEDGTTLGFEGFTDYGSPIINCEKVAINGINDNIIPQLTFFRNAKKLYVKILDENKKVVRILAVKNNITKNVFDEDMDNEADTYDMKDWAWDGKIYNNSTGEYEIAKQGQYYIQIKSKIDFEGAQYQILNMPIKVDVTSPKIYGVNIYAGKLKFRAQDDFSGISHFVIKIKNKKFEDENGNSELVLKPDKNGLYTVDVDLYQYDKLEIFVVDNAENAGKYSIEVGEINDDFKIVVDKYSNKADFEDAIFINSNKTTIKGYATEKVKSLKIMDKEVDVKEDLSFEADVDLNVGLNKIKIYAESEDGDICDYAYNLYSDAEAPKIVLLNSMDDEELNIVNVENNCSKYVVQGTINDNYVGYKLYINGTEIMNEETYTSKPNSILKYFREEVELNYGINIIEVKAVDSFDNVTIQKIVVIKK
jgi:lactocepin